MMYYVKVVEGKVIGVPQVLSDSNFASPNSNWTEEQLKLNGFFLVDISHDEKTQKVDYNNPIVSADSVTYKILDKTQEEISVEYSENYQELRRNDYFKNGLDPDALTIALWEMIFENKSNLANEIQAKRLETKAKYPKP